MKMKFEIHVNMFIINLKFCLYFIHLIQIVYNIKHDFSMNIRKNLKTFLPELEDDYYLFQSD